MKTLEINWKLNSYCEYGCEYCHGKWSKGSLDKTENAKKIEAELDTKIQRIIVEMKLS